MKELPPNMVAYQRTKEFNNETVPAGLLRSHTTKRGVWGRIHVLEGSLRYRILEPTIEEIILSAERNADEAGGDGGREATGIVEPENPHEVECIGKVRFYVEFFRAGEATAPE